MPAYETAGGEALGAVETLCRHIATPAGFSTTTTPTLAQVQRFANQAYYKIAGALGDAGYAVGQTDAEVLGFLQNLQVLETVILVELSRPITGTGEPNERFMAFMAERDQLYELLKSGMLDGMGALPASGATSFTAVTGVSISRKNGVADDSDYVRPRFKRGQWTQPGSPGTTRLAADTLG